MVAALSCREPAKPAHVAPAARGEASSPSSAPADPALHVASWNVKHLGRPRMSYAAIASLLRGVDLVTFQEVNLRGTGQVALQRVAVEWSNIAHERVCSAFSEVPTGAQERYAYLWLDRRVAFVKRDGTRIERCPSAALVVPLANLNAALIVREPAVAQFELRGTGKRFRLASVHLVPSGKKPQSEVPPLFETFRSRDGAIIVAGDFNLSDAHPVFAGARALGFAPALRGVKTSLKMKKRELSRAYDNFWFRDMRLESYKVLNLYAAFPSLPAKEIYDEISDHSPVLATFTLP